MTISAIGTADAVPVPAFTRQRSQVRVLLRPPRGSLALARDPFRIQIRKHLPNLGSSCVYRAHRRVCRKVGSSGELVEHVGSSILGSGRHTPVHIEHRDSRSVAGVSNFSSPRSRLREKTFSVAFAGIIPADDTWATRSCALEVTASRTPLPDACVAKGLLEVPRRVHALVQNPDHVHATGALNEEHQMATDAVSSIPLSNLVTGSSTSRIIRDALDRGPDFRYIRFGLGGAPMLFGVIPDRREVTLCGWREPVAAHAFFSAMNLSKSNVSGSPLSSPATRAARSAAICVAWSSRRRKPARTTSLADR